MADSRRTDTPEAAGSADGIKCRATWCFRPVVEAERDAARAALDRALDVLDALVKNIPEDGCMQSSYGDECYWCVALTRLNEEHEPDCPLVAARALLAESRPE